MVFKPASLWYSVTATGTKTRPQGTFHGGLWQSGRHTEVNVGEPPRGGALLCGTDQPAPGTRYPEGQVRPSPLSVANRFHHPKQKLRPVK